MPVIDGLETCRKIRVDPKFRFTKIIFVSGRVDIGDRLAGYTAGGDDYITKPYDEEELLAKIKIMLRLEHEERISEMKSHFLALIAHETRTPLNGIIGFANLLSRDGSEKCRQMSAMILESGKRLLDFTQKAALLCELKTDYQLRKTPQSIQKIIECVADEFRKHMDSKDISLAYTENDDKSGLAVGILRQALIAGFRGRYYDVQRLLDDLYASLADRSTTKLLNTLCRYEILLLDELGYLTLNREQMNAFFKLMKERYEAKKSTIITTNLEPDEWYSLLKPKDMVDALLDRLHHRCVVINVPGPSLRDGTSE